MNKGRNITNKENTLVNLGFEQVLTTPFAFVHEKGSAIAITARHSYIPIEDFKKLFTSVGERVKKGDYNLLIFDKRNLSVFDQPSMEWYFVEWKAEMAEYGLTKHRKLLPDDDVFRECVRLGKEQIALDHPNGTFKNLDIGYADSLEEALQG